MFINAPFLHTASSGDADYCHNLVLRQLMDAVSFVLTPLNTRRNESFTTMTGSQEYDHREVLLWQSTDVISVKFQLFLRLYKLSSI